MFLWPEKLLKSRDQDYRGCDSCGIVIAWCLYTPLLADNTGPSKHAERMDKQLTR